jgi:hypothetical protein
MLDGLAAQHNDKRFSPMGIYIGNRMAESLYQFGSTFLHHGTPSLHGYSLFVYFYSFIGRRASSNFGKVNISSLRDPPIHFGMYTDFRMTVRA